MFANDFVIGADRLLLLHRAEQFVNGSAAVKRRDQRLLERHRAIERTHVAPRLEIVRLRNVPGANGGRFVVINADVNVRLIFASRVGEFQIGAALNRRGLRPERRLFAMSPRNSRAKSRRDSIWFPG